jgi:outer membrane protein
MKQARWSTVIPLIAAATLNWLPASSSLAAPAGHSCSTANDSSCWGVGAGAILDRPIYRGSDSRQRLLPLLSFENRHIRLLGPTIDLLLPTDGPLSLAIRGRYYFDGYEPDDSLYLLGMDEREGSLWAGGSMKWRFGDSTISAELLGDLLDRSSGLRAKLQLDRRFQTGAVGITPRIDAEWLDEDQVDYYYGVEPTETRSWRPLHQPGSTLNSSAGLRIDWQPIEHHNLFLDLSVTRPGSGIRNSPLVDESLQQRLFTGYLYRF